MESDGFWKTSHLQLGVFPRKKKGSEKLSGSIRESAPEKNGEGGLKVFCLISCLDINGSRISVISTSDGKIWRFCGLFW